MLDKHTQESLNRRDKLDETRAFIKSSKGFGYCKNSIPLLRYINEKNDLGLEEFVRKQMGENVYSRWLALTK